MKNMAEVDVSFREIALIIWRRRSIIAIVSVVIALLAGSMGYFHSLKASGPADVPEEKKLEQYEEDVLLNEALTESQDFLSRRIKQQWGNIYNDQLNNPLYTVNPYQCEYELIVIVFSDGKNHDYSVNNWIAEADDDKLFGQSSDKLGKYKTSLIYSGVVPLSDNVPSYETNETVVQVISVDDFDISRATDYLTGYIRQMAESDQLEIESISPAHFAGRNNYVKAYQDSSTYRIERAHATLEKIAGIKSFVSEPSLSDESASVVKKKVLMKTVIFAIIGLLLGFVISACLMVIIAVRRGFVISCRQFENAFELDMLGDFSQGNETALEVLNANLDIMTGEGSRIVLTGHENDRDIEELMSMWKSSDSRQFDYANDIFNDPGDIDMLRNAAGIVIHLRLGKSRFDRIQRTILRAQKLKIPVLGYVLV